MVNVVPWDLPRHNIHHDTSSAFSNNVPLYIYTAACYLGGLLLADLFVSFKNLKQ